MKRNQQMKRSMLLPLIVLGLMCPTVNAVVVKKNNHHTEAKQQAPKTANNQTQTGAIAIILNDHNHIRKMITDLKKIIGNDMDASRTQFKNLKDFLIKHETMEQKVWYPELEKNADLKDLIAHLKKEEDDAASELKKVDDNMNKNEWVANVRKIMKAVDHHASEEETKLFPKVKKHFDQAQLDSIGEKLNKYRNDNNMKY